MMLLPGLQQQSARPAFSRVLKANPAFWLRANSLGLVDGGAVAAWPSDLSRAVAPSQSVSLSKPTYLAAGVNSSPGVSFNGTSSRLATSYSTTAGSHTFIAVAKRIAGPASAQCVAQVNDRGAIIYGRLSPSLATWGTYAGTQIDSGVSIDGVAAVLVVIARAFNDIDLITYQPGKTKVTRTNGTSWYTTSIPTGLFAGAAGVSLAPENAFQFFSGVVGEVLYFQSVIAESEIDRIANWFCSIYGIV